MTNDKNMTEILKLPEMLDIWQQTLGWQPNVEQQQLFQQLYQEIVAGNQQLNLTRITEPVDFWEKHLWDSLRGVGNLLSDANNAVNPTQKKAIDIGTGGGFPGLPLAIAFPHFSLTLLDSTRKKINFIDTLISQLELNNVTTLVDRAEAIAQHPQHRQSYELAFLRAVAPAPVCANYALPLLKNGGLAILYRGHWTDEETQELKVVVEQLGGVVESIESFTTPISNGVRHCIYLRSCSLPKEVPIKKKKGKRK